MTVRDLGEGAEVRDVAERIADGFAEDRLGLRVDQLLEFFRLAVIREAHLDAELREGVREQVVCAAIQRTRGDDVVAGLGDRHDGIGDGGAAGREAEARDAAFELGDALLEHVRRRVHDPGVDVALHLQIEQVCAMLRAVERIGRGLVDRDRDGLGGGIGRIAAVHGNGFRAHQSLLFGIQIAAQRGVEAWDVHQEGVMAFA